MPLPLCFRMALGSKSPDRLQIFHRFFFNPVEVTISCRMPKFVPYAKIRAVCQNL